MAGSGIGAWRAAQEMTARLGVPVSPGGIEELASRGLIAAAGTFKGCQLYDTSTLADVTAADADAAEAAASCVVP